MIAANLSGGDPHGRLLERANELGAIAAGVRAALNGEGRALVIEGPPGIGKSALLEEARSMALTAGMQVLAARGGHVACDVGWGVVEQLFGRAARADTRLLSGQAHSTAPIFGLDRPQPGSASDSAFPSTHGLYWLTVNIAERCPLVLLVDDVQHADLASAGFLAYVAQRLDGVPALVVVALRSGTAAERVQQAVARFETIWPRPLSPAATSSLVRAALGACDDQIPAACHRATGGNAFLLTELIREIAALGPDAALTAIERTPANVKGSIAARLETFTAPARRIAHAVAVLGDGTPLWAAASLAGLDLEVAGEAADALRSGAILSDRARLEFLHPIIRSAVYDELAAEQRSRLHAQAARVLADGPSSSEQVAAHLLRCEPRGDPTTRDRLRAAAQEAMRRGAPDSAVAYLRHAIAGPASARSRVELLMDLARAEASVFAVDAACEHLRGALEAASGRDERLQVARVAGSLIPHSDRADAVMRAWLPLLARVRDEFADRPEIAATIDADIANAGRFDLGGRQLAITVSRRLRCQAGTVGDDRLNRVDATVLAAYAAELTMAGEPAARAIEIARLGIARLRGNEQTLSSHIHLVLVRTLITADQLDDAGRILDKLVADSAKRGSIFEFAFASTFRAHLNNRRGDVCEAEADARAALSVAREQRWTVGGPGVAAELVHALIERDELEAAEQLLTQSELVGEASALPTPYTSNLLLYARGRLRASAGRHVAAVVDLLECGRRQALWEEHNPALIPWRSEAALALNALGDRQRALELADDELGRARRFGAPRALGIALSAAAMLADRSAASLDLAGEAADVLGRSSARLEHARSLACLGELLHGGGRTLDARAALKDALELSHLCGAAAVERRARDSLRATGARPRRPRLSGPNALTPSERRVATMAASGMSNREIAEALFVTVRTIEFHLGGAYRKLEIDGRAQLSRALAGQAAPRRAQRPAV